MNDNMKLKTATFAGGCFWCTESDFGTKKGVTKVMSGYTGGHTEQPAYEQVCSGRTGHVEAIQVTYNPDKVSYEQLLDIFWRHVDPTDPGGQFVDRGAQYRTVIFYHSEEQKSVAEKSKRALDQSGRFDRRIVTHILPAQIFYPAEDHHQDYHKKNPLRYKFYRRNSGRDRFLEKVWTSKKQVKPMPANTEYTKPDDDNLRKRLTPLQYKVTQQEGTEPPFKNKYWDNKDEGIYVDVVSGEPLFSSKDKFDSGTGWPSFTRPITSEFIVQEKDSSLFMVRTQVRSKHGNSHLGHLFEDGPPPTGLRYCVNSAALKFIARDKLADNGYSHYGALFDK